MARPLRIEFPGAWYHVMHRGAGRQWVFKSNTHYHRFLELLGDVSERFSAEIHAYCLMGNHYHLMIRTPDGNLQRVMRHLNGVYTQYFNRVQQRDGALFRGRYKAILVDANDYWLELSRYIHRNPLEARVVTVVEKYKWSSYPAYIGKKKAPAWLHTDEILGSMGDGRLARKRYKAFTEQRNSPDITDHYKDGTTPVILGNKIFKACVLDGVFEDPSIPDIRKVKDKPDMQSVINIVADYYGCNRSEVLINHGKSFNSPVRSVAMYCLHQYDILTLEEIANHFGLSSYASAGSTVRNLRKRVRNEKQLQDDINYIMQALTP